MQARHKRSSPALFERVEPGPRKAHKRQILSCALDCFDTLGFDATTIETIRESAGSSTGSIYHHFKNKDGLIAALFFAALDDQLELMKPKMAAVTAPKEAIEALVSTYLEWVTQQPRLAKFLYRARHLVADGPYAQELAARNKLRFGSMFDWLMQGVKAGEIRSLPKETYASLLIGQSENYCRAWLSERVKGPPTDHAAIFTEAAWRSVCVQVNESR